MVRQKNRWMVVQFDYEADLLSRCTPSSESSTPKSKKRKLSRSDSQSSGGNLDEQVQISQMTSTDIFRSLQETLTQNFGIVASSTTDLSVRLYDPKFRLAVIKTSRDKYPIVRSSLVFLTKIKHIKVVASAISVSGSARTARNAAWKECQKQFFNKETAIEYGSSICHRNNNDIRNDTATVKKVRAAAKRALSELEERIEKVDSSC
jgi:RNase P/RNase MRP subunit POP5